MCLVIDFEVWVQVVFYQVVVFFDEFFGVDDYFVVQDVGCVFVQYVVGQQVEFEGFVFCVDCVVCVGFVLIVYYVFGFGGQKIDNFFFVFIVLLGIDNCNFRYFSFLVMCLDLFFLFFCYLYRG